jgi:hypothetical protein
MDEIKRRKYDRQTHAAMFSSLYLQGKTKVRLKQIQQKSGTHEGKLGK